MESTTLSEALATTSEDFTTPTIFNAISTPSRGSDSSVDQISQAQAADVGVVVGSVIGTLVPVTILLSVVAILTLALVHLAKKYRSVTKFKGRGSRVPAAQNTYTLDMEMNSNEAYSLTTSRRSRLDSMESNAAYGGVTVNPESYTSNNLYEYIESNEVPSKDNDIAQAHGRVEQIENEEDFTGGTVYEYIDGSDKYI